MSRAQTKRDNWALAAKVSLRVRHLPEVDPVRVLDVFHGRGAIWAAVEAQCGRRCEVTGIDMRDIPGVVQLRGDNLKYLPTLNLRLYDVIDLDAYGSPFPQLESIFCNPSRQDGTVVYYTFIRSSLGSQSRGMLRALGYTDAMVKKCPTLFGRNAHEKWLAYLGARGVREVSFIERSNRGIHVGTVDRFYGRFLI